MKKSLYRPLLILWLLLCSITNANSQTWQVRFNMSQEGLQSALNELAPLGYVPNYIDAVEKDKQAYYQAIWRYEPSVAWRQWSKISTARLQQLIDELSPQGFILTSIKGYTIGEQTFYTAIWRRDQAVNWETHFGLNRSEFDRALNSLKNRGYVPVALSVHDENGLTRFSGIWHQRRNVAWELRYDLTAQEYQRQFNLLTSRGYVPIDMSAYTVNDQTRFSAIWERISGITWEARHNLTFNEVLNFTTSKSSDGYAPFLLTPYLQAGELRYAGAWRYRPQPTIVPDIAASTNLVKVPAGARSRMLAISPVHQQTQVWCWLAIGEMIFQYYDVPNVNQANNFQCGIIGLISGPNSPCYSACRRCVRPSGSNYGTLEMLSIYSRRAGNRTFQYSESRAISPEALMANIDSGRPVIAGTSYNHRIADMDAEHVALIIGYELSNGRLSLIVNDPFPYAASQNPFLRHGGTLLADNQYRISYAAFRDQVFWHWSVFNIDIY